MHLAHQIKRPYLERNHLGIDWVAIVPTHNSK